MIRLATISTAAIIATVGAIIPAHAGYLIPVVPVSGGTQTLATGINDDSIIVGSYIGTDGRQHGFDGTLQGAYTSFDVPNATQTEPTSINNLGTIIGNSNVGAFYGDENGQDIIIGEGAKNKPLPDETANGLNNDNEFVGYYLNKTDKTWHSYYGSSGTYTSDFNLGDGAGSTYAYGINGSGAVVGYAYINGDGTYHAFLYQNGNVTFIDYPEAGAYSTIPLAINDNGLVTGSFHDGDKTYGFFYDSKKGSFKTLTVKGAEGVSIQGSNSAGFAAVIAYFKRGIPSSYIYCPNSKTQCQQLASKGMVHRLD